MWKVSESGVHSVPTQALIVNRRRHDSGLIVPFARDIVRDIVAVE